MPGLEVRLVCLLDGKKPTSRFYSRTVLKQRNNLTEFVQQRCHWLLQGPNDGFFY